MVELHQFSEMVNGHNHYICRITFVFSELQKISLTALVINIDTVKFRARRAVCRRVLVFLDPGLTFKNYKIYKCIKKVNLVSIV